MNITEEGLARMRRKKEKMEMMKRRKKEVIKLRRDNLDILIDTVNNIAYLVDWSAMRVTMLTQHDEVRRGGAVEDSSSRGREKERKEKKSDMRQAGTISKEIPNLINRGL